MFLTCYNDLFANIEGTALLPSLLATICSGLMSTFTLIKDVTEQCEAHTQQKCHSSAACLRELEQRERIWAL